MVSPGERRLNFFSSSCEQPADIMTNGVNHMCLAVDDLDATVAGIKAAGIALTSEIKTGLDHNRQAWLEDPDGNRIELMEMAANSLQAEAIERLRGTTKSG